MIKDKNLSKKLSDDVDEMEKMLNDYLQFASTGAKDKTENFDLSDLIESLINKYENPNISNCYIEVHATEINVLNESKTPPFEVNSENIDETTRLRYRFLDLRSSRMQNNIRLRNDVILSICNFLNDKNFVHIETPILIKSTPEGARDYIVPSRVHPG